MIKGQINVICIRMENRGLAILRELEMELEYNFEHVPTPSQSRLIQALARFLISEKPHCLLLVKGYAGTGKTSMVNMLVKTLGKVNMRAVLLAPTGRAAKVLAGYTEKNAFTIHKKIYFMQNSESERMHFVPAQNLHRNTVFVVDEASMIGWEDYARPGGGNLLLDLFTYVYNGRNCRLILIGDGAQLPPVGSARSPALDLKFLKSEFSLTAALCELTEVMRQREESGILALATDLRACVESESGLSRLPLEIPAVADVTPVFGADLQDVLEDVFTTYGVEGAVIVSRSNKRCNQFNREIRARVFFREEPVSAGDYVMAVKNNYHWLDAGSGAGFLANGDIMEILRIDKTVTRYGFNFVHATVRLIDYPNEPHLEVVLWVDALEVDAASMTGEDWEKLYRGVSEDYAHLNTKTARKQAIKKDPYYNAVQVKFAYAVTCHKAQGGQWPAVIVDQGYLTEDMIDVEYFRWLYTAVTRASERLYLLNFSERIFTIE